MVFRTVTEIKQNDRMVSHSDGIMLLGSCFAENIGRRLEDGMYDTDINPFGTLYNPSSIARTIRRVVAATPYDYTELFYSDGLWHSFDHHSRFSGSEQKTVLERINSRLQAAHEHLRRARLLIITFGTAFVFRLADNGAIVANCHKLPSSRFSRTRLTEQEIIEDWNTTLQMLAEFNPELQIVFTVSPVRHLADGLHGNQLSKATLLLATDKLVQVNCQCRYFPSYEIVTDELRDYRFYAADMVHPSEVAADYVAERFCEAFTTEQARRKAEQCKKLVTMTRHRPMTDNVVSLTKFRNSTLALARKLQEQMPYLEKKINKLIEK